MNWVSINIVPFQIPLQQLLFTSGAKPRYSCKEFWARLPDSYLVTKKNLIDSQAIMMSKNLENFIILETYAESCKILKCLTNLK